MLPKLDDDDGDVTSCCQSISIPLIEHLLMHFVTLPALARRTYELRY